LQIQYKFNRDNISCSSDTVPLISVITCYMEVTKLSMSTDKIYKLEARFNWYLWSDCYCFVAGEVVLPSYTGQVAAQSRCKICLGWLILSRTCFLFDLWS